MYLFFVLIFNVEDKIYCFIIIICDDKIYASFIQTISFYYCLELDFSFIKGSYL